MPKLMDDVKVAELVAKQRAQAVATFAKAKIAAIKAITTEHLNFHTTEGNKGGTKAVRDHSKEVVAALKAVD